VAEERHREQQIFLGFRAHQAVIVANAGFQPGRQRRRRHPAANLAPGLGQGDGASTLRVASRRRSACRVVVGQILTEGGRPWWRSRRDANTLFGQL